MVRLKKPIVFFLCMITVLSSFCLSVGAADIENEKTYEPLDLVVVIDSSGSMLDSDPSRTALAAVKMLVNMMPAEESKVGLIGFNKTATVLTKDAKGNDALLSLKSLNDVATIKKTVSGIVFNGGTGIGNAVFEATELLRKNKSDKRSQAIILFTDGVNDFGNDPVALSNCEENEASALLWAKKNNCPIYCVGYDYIQADGSSSMGANGEGLKKLNNIASTTQGKFKSINSIKEMEQLLIEFVADVSDLVYTTVATIPGDGGTHECPINVSPSVVEANIRIAGGDENSIANGKIQLFDPDGNEIELRNSGNVRFDTDATAASIKVTMPKTGEWRLVVKGIKGDDIHVGLLEHFKRNLTSKIILPEGNPDGVAYNGDEVGIKTWITYDGKDLNDEAIYAAVKSATAVCVPRANPENPKKITLQRDGYSFVGSFIIPEDCFYDITIRLDWDTIYREDTLEIQSSNKPLYAVDEIPDVKVNKNKTITVDNLYQYIADDENDDIEVKLGSMSNADVADVKIQGDSLVIKGNKWSSTTASLLYKDEQGNEIEQIFKIKVNDPVALALIIGGFMLAGIITLLVLFIGYKKSLKIKGDLHIENISIVDTDVTIDKFQSLMYEGNGPVIGLTRYSRNKSLHRLDGVINEIKKCYDNSDIGTAENEIFEYIARHKEGKKLLSGSEKVKIIGSPLGNTFTIKKLKSCRYLSINNRDYKYLKVNDGDNLNLIFKERNSANRTTVRAIEIHCVFRSTARIRNNNRRTRSRRTRR